MMRPFLHDVMTVLQSKGFIAIFVFFLLLPLTLIPDIAQANIPEFDLQPSIIIADHDTQGLNFLAYTTDKYGQPIPSTLYIDIGIPNVGSKHVVISQMNLAWGLVQLKSRGLQ